MEKYSLQLIWSEEENAYVAMSPEMPHLTQTAETAQEAVQKLDGTIAAFLAEKKGHGEALPAPKCLESYSGQFRLRVPRGLHAALARAAEGEGVSLNTYIVHLLSERHAMHQTRRQVVSVRSVSSVQVTKTVRQSGDQQISNITVMSAASQGADFSWRNDSCATITQVQ